MGGGASVGISLIRFAKGAMQGGYRNSGRLYERLNVRFELKDV